MVSFRPRSAPPGSRCSTPPSSHAPRRQSWSMLGGRTRLGRGRRAAGLPDPGQPGHLLYARHGAPAVDRPRHPITAIPNTARSHTPRRGARAVRADGRASARVRPLRSRRRARLAAVDRRRTCCTRAAFPIPATRCSRRGGSRASPPAGARSRGISSTATSSTRCRCTLTLSDAHVPAGDWLGAPVHPGRRRPAARRRTCSR